jgi:hypothetical protein
VNVRLVLDASALLAYARLASVAVGELIGMVEEHDGESLVGIPAASFLAAHRVLGADEQDRLVGLATASDGVSVVLPLVGADAVEVAELEAAESGADGIGHAIVEAGRLSALLATYHGDSARRWLAAEDVLDLSS